MSYVAFNVMTCFLLYVTSRLEDLKASNFRDQYMDDNDSNPQSQIKTGAVSTIC